jgi:uncharacterized protein YyaL (SSP411 family)
MTRPVGPDARSKPNRLLTSSSPYLLQHAYNPVDWFPWGEEAFEIARSQDRPIFLSIGYATCHWCHVMAHESFEDEGVAALLNDGFVSIKLDREERPDIDAVYMTVCQLMTGQGGWPLTIVMTPDLRPFFAGTYFPRESRQGRIGMLELVPRLLGLWEDRRSDIEASADSAVGALRDMEDRYETTDGTGLDAEVLATGFRALDQRFDPHQGGFGQAPRFPTPHNLLFLLRWHDRTGEPQALAMVEKTLTMMRRGGIFDHVGFGFHRYSTDARWLLPHFEKMLYDQALLTMAYVETWQVTGDDRYRRTAEEILEYVIRDLTDERGGFYSAEDADSDGREGAFYVWTRAEFESALSHLDPEDVAFAFRAFDVAGRGNFADEATGRMTGENILHLTQSLSDLASEMSTTSSEVMERMERVRDALMAARAPRPRPLLDDKILTDWNGLMIAAFALAGRAFESERYVAAAVSAAEFILDSLRVEEGLLHRYRAGEAGIQGGAADFAYLAWGLLELYAATLDVRWLEEAVALGGQLVDGFWDDTRGGVFAAREGADDVIVRQRDIYDGATPSANAATWYVLLRLSRLTGDPVWEEKASEIASAFEETVMRTPAAHTMSLVALDLALGPSREVVVAGPRGGRDTERLLSTLRSGFRPRTSVLLRDSDGDAEALTRLAPFTDGHAQVDGEAAAYVCTDFACQRPTTDASVMVTLLD